MIMSLLNVWVEHERALVGVDTHAMHLGPNGQPLVVNGFPAGARFETSKMIPLVHLNAVLAVRGTAALLVHVFMHCNLKPRQGLDEIFRDLPLILDQSFPELKRVPGAVAAGQEVLLVGWSRQAGRMRALMLKQEPTRDAFVPNEVEELWIGPWDDDVQGAPVDPSDDRSMAELMQAQRRDARERFPELPIGGRALIADLSRDGMSFREVADLERAVGGSVADTITRLFPGTSHIFGQRKRPVSRG